MDKQAFFKKILEPFNRISNLEKKIGFRKDRIREYVKALRFQGIKKGKDIRNASPRIVKGIESIRKRQAELADIREAIKRTFLLSGGAAAGAVGGGALYSGIADKLKRPIKEEELKKIKTSLALQELQSDIGQESDVFGKTSATMSPQHRKALQWLGVGAVAAPAALIPGYMSWKALRNLKATKKKKETLEEINQLRLKYDKKFKESVLEDLSIEPAELKSTLEDITKVSKENSMYKMALRSPWPLATALAGTGAGIYAFGKGKEKGEASSVSTQKMKSYREMLDRVVRLRNAPVVVSEGSFSPEEMVAMEKIRRESPTTRKIKKSKTKADVVKDTKGGTALPKTVSTKANDPALQELLSSI